MNWFVTLIEPESGQVIGGKNVSVIGAPKNPRYEAQKVFLDSLTKGTPYEGMPISKVVKFLRAKAEEDNRVKALPNGFSLETFFKEARVNN
jgi:rRNA processing protein Krr1/Pno1